MNSLSRDKIATWPLMHVDVLNLGTSKKKNSYRYVIHFNLLHDEASDTWIYIG